MRPNFSSVTRNVNKPDNSNDCNPPSRPSRTIILSSARKCILYVIEIGLGLTCFLLTFTKTYSSIGMSGFGRETDDELAVTGA